MSIGQNLKRLRMQRMWNQRELAQRLNINSNYISAVEHGRIVPSLPTIDKLCDALECTPNDLMGYEAPTAQACGQ